MKGIKTIRTTVSLEINTIEESINLFNRSINVDKYNHNYLSTAFTTSSKLFNYATKLSDYNLPVSEDIWRGTELYVGTTDETIKVIVIQTYLFTIVIPYDKNNSFSTIYICYSIALHTLLECFTFVRTGVENANHSIVTHLKLDKRQYIYFDNKNSFDIYDEIHNNKLTFLLTLLTDFLLNKSSDTTKGIIIQQYKEVYASTNRSDMSILKYTYAIISKDYIISLNNLLIDIKRLSKQNNINSY